MHIYFERTGGHKGILVYLNVDTESMPPEKSKMVREMVHGADFFSLSPRIPSASTGEHFYRITVDERKDGQRKHHTVEILKPDVPENLKQLVDYLSEESSDKIGGRMSGK